MRLQIDIEQLKSSFQIKFEGELFTGWGINHFPDGQLQFWIEPWREHRTPSKPMRDGGSLTASISNPAELDVFNQMVEALWLNEITVLYCYGARCDKPYAGKNYVTPVAKFFLDSLVRKSDTNVTVLSPHCHKLISENSLAYSELNVDFFIPEEVLNKGYDTWIYPDKSAFERFGSKQPDNVRGVFCNKTRDQLTGEIIEHTIEWPENYTASKILVIDDLCDGGRTFLDIAQMVYNDDNVKWAGAGILDLYVTHGVFSGNVDHLTYLYDTIYVTNSLRHVHEIAKQFPSIKVTNVW